MTAFDEKEAPIFVENENLKHKKLKSTPGGDVTYTIGFLSYEWLRKSRIDGLAACIEGFLHHFVFMLFIQYRMLTITYKMEYKSQMRLLYRTVYRLCFCRT